MMQNMQLRKCMIKKLMVDIDLQWNHLEKRKTEEDKEVEVEAKVVINVVEEEGGTLYINLVVRRHHHTHQVHIHLLKAQAIHHHLLHHLWTLMIQEIRKEIHHHQKNNDRININVEMSKIWSYVLPFCRIEWLFCI